MPRVEHRDRGPSKKLWTANDADRAHKTTKVLSEATVHDNTRDIYVYRQDEVPWVPAYLNFRVENANLAVKRKVYASTP